MLLFLAPSWRHYYFFLLFFNTTSCVRTGRIFCFQPFPRNPRQSFPKPQNRYLSIPKSHLQDALKEGRGEGEAKKRKLNLSLPRGVCVGGNKATNALASPQYLLMCVIYLVIWLPMPTECIKAIISQSSQLFLLYFSSSHVLRYLQLKKNR